VRNGNEIADITAGTARQDNVIREAFNLGLAGWGIHMFVKLQHTY
jgi:hypothetical protein